VLIEKNEGEGVDGVYVETGRNGTGFILQTNTDVGRVDPDGRRDVGVGKMERAIKNKGYVTRQDVRDILF